VNLPDAVYATSTMDLRLRYFSQSARVPLHPIQYSLVGSREEKGKEYTLDNVLEGEEKGKEYTFNNVQENEEKPELLEDWDQRDVITTLTRDDVLS
jgi:hypothetical protein